MIAVKRSQDDHGLSHIAGEQAVHQIMARAPEGRGFAVLRNAQRRVAVAIVIGAAKDHHRVGGKIHLLHAHAVVAVVTFLRHHRLTGEARAGNAVVVGALEAEFTRQHVGEAVFHRGRAYALGDAVAQKIDHCAFEFHGGFLLSRRFRWPCGSVLPPPAPWADRFRSGRPAARARRRRRCRNSGG